MSNLLEKPLGDRAARLDRARDSMKPLLEVSSKFQNSCETVFSEFRISCVHLRRERETMDAVKEKDVAWRYLCKLCQERPFLHDRVHEVLKILMLSDAWMKAFIEDPECDVAALPPDIQDEFKRRTQEALDPSAPRNSANGGYPKQNQHDVKHSPAPAYQLSGTMAVVVQRCTRARLLIDESHDRWAEIGRGLIVSVSFTSNATEEKIFPAARFLLTAKLSTAAKWQPGHRSSTADAESVASICKRGETQGILVMPQVSLVSELGTKDMDLNYSHQLETSRAKCLYTAFVQELERCSEELIKGPKTCLPQIVAGPFESSQVMELTSAGPFMHSFTV
eukprot:TRINITY_DN31660_c0_g1_i2.p1 TRINITY_DN31660_c0_g1~~TRINITY_DN31660_c0_g1_i2.p1  ORF type:complete len:346 (+),score=47.03 TRINITY_DN31660_c0_g1_i2:32-1039(+)